MSLHCAKKGNKIDALKKHNKVSFTVIAEDRVLPERTSTCYRSVIVFGRARLAGTPEEKRQALQLLVEKYSPQRMAECERIIEKKMDNVQVIVLDIEHLSGKEAIELTKEKSRYNFSRL